MKRMSIKQTGICFALGFGIIPFLVYGVAGFSQDKINVGETQHFQGKVVPLDDLLKKVGSNLDKEASPHWMVLVTEDGHYYPIIRDELSQMFFKDPKVRNRPMKITGRLFADTHLLQVLNVNSVKEGKLHEIYYWCGICAIRRNSGGICDCCGDPMHLKEVPLAGNR